MPTVVLDAYSKAYPAIINRIRASVFLETDPTALVATIIDAVAGHPARIWHFPGLPRANYGFSLDEIDGGGTPINNLALFDVVPGSVDSILVRDDEQIKVDTTPGFVSGTQVAVFDGTGGKPNYIGWNIVPSELTGRGILALGLDYSWDATTATFTLLQAGDTLPGEQIYNIHFDPILSPGGIGGSPSTVNDFSTRIATVDGNIDITDFGGTIIVEPDGTYLELTLPDITTVPQGRCVTIETIMVLGNGVQCVKVLAGGADVINFLRGNIYMMNNESLQVYRFRRPDTSNEWRVRNCDGNFKSVGEMIGDDAIQSGVYCKQLLDGSIKNKNQFARIYNEVVLNLPLTQVVSFDTWATGNNKYLYSKADSSDPAQLDNFHFPDRRNLFERNNNAGKAGDFQDQDIQPHRHRVRIGGSNAHDPVAGLTKSSLQDGLSDSGSAGSFLEDTGTTETRPKNYLINKYVKI